MTHTQTPWYNTGAHVQSAVINEDNYVCEAEGDTPEQAEANAKHIVRCVNNHDALVEALKESLALNINYEAVEEKTGHEFTEAGAVIAMARAAIAKATEAL